MKLIRLSYKDVNWELKSLELDLLNLIVAKNSTGKSRTLSTIDLLVKIITQRRDLNWGGRWEMDFINAKEQKITFSFASSQKQGGVVTYETVEIDGKQVLNRTPEHIVQLRSDDSGSYDFVAPPINKLTLHTNRDRVKYSYLEDIVQWAENSYGFKFGNISSSTKLNLQEYDLLTTVDEIPSLFFSLSKRNQKYILKDINELGYALTSLTAEDRGEFVVLYATEEGIEKPLPHYRLSQGLFRSIALIIYVEYLISKKKPATIIVDDFCEGLDYERATKLGRLIFDKCLEGEIQLIVTSNDSFLMDVVDIDYWNILQRKGKVVTAINKRNNNEAFTKFRFTGLSNFDFFSSDFLKK